MVAGSDGLRRLRVIVADDSAVVRAVIRAWLEAEPDIDVVAEAANGAEALAQVLRLRPDVVTMDLDMPVMSGLQAIEEIMCTRAVPILVFSSCQDAEQSCEALRRGAVDVLAKPDFDPAQARLLVARVRLVAGVSVITRRRATAPGRLASVPLPASVPISEPRPAAAASGSGAAAGVLAVASSTGGPQALACILPALPVTFPWTIVVAQHIVAGFAAGMADWLAGLCRLPVQLARDGDWLRPGQIYIAPSEQNLTLGPDRRLALKPPPPGEIYHPNCNVLLESVAQCCGARAVGLILSGMGSDGARGMAAIRAQGGTTLAQDEASSVVFGMNRVAIEAGAIQHVLPAGAIAGALCMLAEIAAAGQPRAEMHP